MTSPATLVVPHRFRGPATSANGGWICGALAEALDPETRDTLRSGAAGARVRLAAPPPLDVAMSLDGFTAEDGASGVRLMFDGALVAEAVAVPPAAADEELTPVPALDADPDRAFTRAEEAGTRYGGLVDHPFPTCLVCGTGRAEGDGLRLRPGPGDPSEGPLDGTVSAAWIPHPAFDSGDGRVDLPLTWAGLDCPGGWSAEVAGRPLVLGTMTARVWRRPRIGERCIVRGLAGEASGRKVATRSTLYGEDGAVLAGAAQIWIVVDPADFNG
jgi:hypothetical protein